MGRGEGGGLRIPLPLGVAVGGRGRLLKRIGGSKEGAQTEPFVYHRAGHHVHHHLSQQRHNAAAYENGNASTGQLSSVSVEDATFPSHPLHQTLIERQTLTECKQNMYKIVSYDVIPPKW